MRQLLKNATIILQKRQSLKYAMFISKCVGTFLLILLFLYVCIQTFRITKVHKSQKVKSVIIVVQEPATEVFTPFLTKGLTT